MIVEIVPATKYHAQDLVRWLRPSDYQSLLRLGKPEEAVEQEIVKSLMAFAGIIDGKTAAVWGAQVVGIFSDQVYIWLVCSSVVDSCPMTFLRHSRMILDGLRRDFKMVYGFVSADFDKSIKWLEWLGFEIREPVDGLRYFTQRL